MNRLTALVGILVVTFVVGYSLGHHAKTVSDNAAVVRQVVKTAKVEAKNEAQVEKQDDSDKTKIRSLEDRLAAAIRDARSRGVPERRATGCVPEAEGDARAREAAGVGGGPAGGYEAAYRALREELLTSAAAAEQMRLQVLSCKAQWP